MIESLSTSGTTDLPLAENMKKRFENSDFGEYTSRNWQPGCKMKVTLFSNRNYAKGRAMFPGIISKQ